jgi:hypothetical protein
MANVHQHDNQPRRSPNWSQINQWLLWIGLAAAVAWLFFRHGEHLSNLLPFLILLACPLMHLFGHGGHGGHGRHGQERQQADRVPRDPDARGGGHAH